MECKYTVRTYDWRGKQIGHNICKDRDDAIEQYKMTVLRVIKETGLRIDSSILVALYMNDTLLKKCDMRSGLCVA